MAGKKILIIDGYNVIAKWPQLTRAWSKNVEYAREKLNIIVQKYCDFKDIKTIIVYDGKSPERTEVKGNPRIIFSAYNETADSIIEYLVRNFSKPQDITVATDDNIQRNFILNIGANFISVKGLQEEINSTLDEMRRMLK